MTTVFVWNNNMVAVRGHSYTGHVSMCIDDDWDDLNVINYVSFWPEEGASKFESVAAGFKKTLGKDVETEQYVPDHVIRITGLNESRMAGVWNTARQELKTYNMHVRNCSTAVARVLKAGASAGGVLKRHNVLWTPLKVKRLALSMGGAKTTWSALVAELVGAGQMSSSDGAALGQVGKRDERHGRNSATGVANFSGGQRVLTKQAVSWPARPAPPQTPYFSLMGGGGAPSGGPMISDSGSIVGGDAWMNDHDAYVDLDD